jgi:hypothetical protein
MKQCRRGVADGQDHDGPAGPVMRAADKLMRRLGERRKRRWDQQTEETHCLVAGPPQHESQNGLGHQQGVKQLEQIPFASEREQVKMLVETTGCIQRQSCQEKLSRGRERANDIG